MSLLEGDPCRTFCNISICWQDTPSFTPFTLVVEYTKTARTDGLFEAASSGDPYRGVPRTFASLDSTRTTESLIQGMVEKLWIWVKMAGLVGDGRF